MIGQTISHYRITEKLGEGGMGVVYKAEDTKLKRFVALKFLRSDVLEDEEHKERFLREAQAAAALDHPNICTVYEIDEAEGQTFLSMAFLEGQTVKEKFKERPLKLDEALDIAIQTAQGLQAAHEKGIVHRDIKSSNLMVTPQVQVKVMDFGLAQLAERSKLTKTTASLGTPSYMSPEQAQKSKTDRRTDIWSLGVVVYEMVTGRLPFEREREQAVLYSIVNEEPEVMTAQRVDVPVELDRIVGKAMAKDADERYQHVDEMLVDFQALRKALAAGGTRTPAVIPSERSGRNWSSGAPMAVGLALLAIGLGLGWWLHGLSEPSVELPTQYRWTRLTSDAGLTYHPAISPDGKLLAYASDRAGADNLDIWVKTVAGGQPSRRTQHEADDYEPAFSPDGSKIAFRSNREGGGIYVMPAIAGQPQLIAKDGRRPRFSPDGNWIAYWVGEALGTNATVYVINSSGGPPRQLVVGFFNASSPIWSPDGNHVLFSGQRMTGMNLDWWVAPLNGGEPIKTGVVDDLGLRAIRQNPIGGQVVPETWSPEGDSVTFSARLGDTADLWRVRISPEIWQVQGAPERLTAGPGLVSQPSHAAGGRLVFATLTSNIDVWSLPVEPNDGRANGEIRQITKDTSDDIHPNLSADGTTLVFLSNRTGNRDVWAMDLDTGEQTLLTDTPEDEAFPIISADGSKVIYRAGAIFQKPTSGGVVEKVCDDCGDPFHWTFDGSKVLHRFAFGPSSIGLFDLTTGENLPVLRHPDYHIFGFQISPDSRWIAFHLGFPGNTQIFVVPFQGEIPRQEKDWIPVTRREALDFHPRWSPDGNLLYYQSTRDSFRCIWAQRLDRRTKRPVGEPFGVYHSHSARRSIGNIAGPQQVWVSVAQDKMVFSMREITGNIWMMERVEAVP